MRRRLDYAAAVQAAVSDCLQSAVREQASAAEPEPVLDELIDALLSALLEVREHKELIAAILARSEAKGLALLVDVTPAYLVVGGGR